MTTARFIPQKFVIAMLIGIGIAEPATAATLEEQFRELTRATMWRKVSETLVQFPTYHPQGMAVVGKRIFVSSVESIAHGNKRDRAHLFEMDSDGRLVRRMNLELNQLYHPGGIDYDGQHIWVSVAEYRPNSWSVVYAIDPETFTSKQVFHFDDHLGAVVFNRQNHTLTGVSWGARRFYTWDMKRDGEGWTPVAPMKPRVRHNGSYYIDYQDAQSIPGTPLALFGGLKSYSLPKPKSGSLSLGGIELLDLRTLRIERQIPIRLWSSTGRVMTQNPFFVEQHEGKLRVYFMPDDDESTLYLYEAN